ncbi:MAG: hypothetical protein IIC99_08495 [Chloroflexi bacterium]|nr:hypothetical protein [Chloroflexota bacterium]
MVLAIWSSLVLAGLVTLGAGPRQGDLPPQPFFPDTVSGRVTLQGKPAPANTTLVACIDDCITVFESAPVQLSEDGSFSGLRVDPVDQRLVGHQIGFYLVNEFGRIRASETVMFQGAVEMHTVDLTFSQAMPMPTPTPTLTPTAALPSPGDPVVTVIPRIALMAGAAAVAAGMFLLYLARRRAF